MSEIDEQTFVNGDIRLHAVCAGPRDGPVVVLLHGFPEFWYCWHKEIPLLAQAGFRVIVPDQRGYNLSSKPAAVRDYALPHLTSDVLAIAGELGREKIFLAGHDWGAAVAWNTAIHFPHRIAKLAILNVPHPSVMMRRIWTPAQLRKSWYVFFFQIPRIPEALFVAHHFRLGIDSLLRTSNPGTFTATDFEHYRRAWSQPSAVRGMIHWYRALFRYPPHIPAGKLTVPTLILWGLRDRFLLPELAAESGTQCDHVSVTYFDRASHWLPHEEPEQVSSCISQFFS